MTTTVLDLFSGLGGFSAAFVDADGYDVVTVDVDPAHDPDIVADVFELRPSDIDRDIDVVLASPPCTYFTPIRNVTTGGDDAWIGGEPNTDDARDALALVYHTVGLIEGLSPEWWVMENPRNRLRTVFEPPDGTVWYCQYGSNYAKPTDLWGRHPPSFEYRSCTYGNDACEHVKVESYTKRGGGSHERQGVLEQTDSARRAKVPYELSAAIRDAVDAPEPEQTTVDAFA